MQRLCWSTSTAALLGVGDPLGDGGDQPLVQPHPRPLPYQPHACQVVTLTMIIKCKLIFPTLQIQNWNTGKYTGALCENMKISMIWSIFNCKLKMWNLMHQGNEVWRGHLHQVNNSSKIVILHLYMQKLRLIVDFWGEMHFSDRNIRQILFCSW